MEETVNLQGTIVWMKEKQPGLFEYGVEFVIDERKRGHLTSLLYQLSTKLRMIHLR